MARTITLPRGARRLRRWVVAGAVALAACGGSGASPAPQGPGDDLTPVPVAAPPASSPSAVPAPGVPPADAAWRTVTARAVITPVDDGAPGWSEAFVIPYGEDEAAVGNGLMESLLEDLTDKADYGPSLATIDDRGRWWVADYYKSRIARYDADGAYIDSISLEAAAPLEALEVFVDGAAVGMTADRRWVVVDDDRASTVAAGNDLVFAGNDGTSAYAWSLFGHDIDAVTVGDRRLPEGRQARWFRTRAGTRYAVDFTADDQLVVTLPDIRTRITVDVLADTGQPVFVSTEFDTDRAGNLHLLLLGHVTAEPLTGDEADQRFVIRAAYVVLSPEGDVLANRAVPDPYGEWDYGVPQRFAVRPDTGQAHIVTVQPDGVRVWQSTTSWAAPRAASVEAGFPAVSIPGH